MGNEITDLNINYYENIKELLVDNEIYKNVKNRSINKSDLTTYYNVGKELAEAGKHYGEGIIKEYSKRLTNELGKGYTFTSLTRIKKFYLLIQKLATVSQQLTYGHYVELLPIQNIDKIKYYINITEKQNLSIRQLRQKIKENEYERLPEETRKKLINKEEPNIKDLIPNPIVINNPSNKNIIEEKELKQLILEDIESFMNKLGNGYSFIGSEYKIKIGNNYNYIDFLFYNIEFNCYVVIELKSTKLKKEHIGQIEVYMNYINTNLKKINQDDTIGIILCKEDNTYIMGYCSDDRILSRKYEFV